MRVIVTGATGFVGTHLVSALLNRGHTVVAVARDPSRAETCEWYDRVDFVACNVLTPFTSVRQYFGDADAVAHLAWQGLPNYKDLFHFEHNLPGSYAFIKALVHSGYSNVLVTGTCFEYGLQSGCLNETHHPFPVTPYGLAKDVLRRFLCSLQDVASFRLQWARLFYMFGAGQHPNSLIAQLESAISRGDAVFDMSGGEQLRDYLPVGEVARRLVRLLEHSTAEGIFNICSGTPVSVRRLVEQQIAEKDAQISLNLGCYPYPVYEPLAFWGDTNKYTSLDESV